MKQAFLSLTIMSLLLSQCAPWTTHQQTSGQAVVRMESEPAGAAVYVGGKAMGTAPVDVSIPYSKTTTTVFRRPHGTGAGVGLGLGIPVTLTGALMMAADGSRTDQGGVFVAGGVLLGLGALTSIISGILVGETEVVSRDITYAPESVALQMSLSGYDPVQEYVAVSDYPGTVQRTLEPSTRSVVAEPLVEVRPCALVLNTFPLGASVFVGGTRGPTDVGAGLGTAPATVRCVVTRVTHERQTIDYFGNVLDKQTSYDYAVTFPDVVGFPTVERRMTQVPMFLGWGQQHAIRTLSFDADELLVRGVVERTLVVSTDLDQARREAQEAERVAQQVAAETAAREARLRGGYATGQAGSSPASPPSRPKSGTILIDGKSFSFVRDPSWTCTACVAACIAAAERVGACRMVAGGAARLLPGWLGVVGGVVTGAVCDQEAVKKPCTSFCCD